MKAMRYAVRNSVHLKTESQILFLYLFFLSKVEVEEAKG
jgi:hypothetical protein